MPLLCNFFRFKQLVVAIAFLLLSGASVRAVEVDFESQVKPIFAEYCLSCHDEENEEGGFLIDRETALDYIIAGNAEESDFFKYLVSEDEDELMPPPDAENPLSQQQITLVRSWIDEGAKWPEDVKIEDAALQLSDSSDGLDASGDLDTDARLVADDLDDDSKDADGTEAKTEITPELLKNATGSLHPAAIHLPIGLLLASGLFAFLSLRGNFVMSDCAYYCLWVGALGSIAACVTGWFYSPMEHQGDVLVLADLWDTTQDVFLHRTWAIGSSVAALFLAMMAMGTRARDPDDGMMWKLGTIILAGVIGWVGHLGGELTYGKAHYKELNTVIESAIPALKQLTNAGDADDEVGEESSLEEGDTPIESDDSESSDGSGLKDEAVGELKLDS
jgi:uncharacterized membrane protein